MFSYRKTVSGYNIALIEFNIKILSKQHARPSRKETLDIHTSYCVTKKGISLFTIVKTSFFVNFMFAQPVFSTPPPALRYALSFCWLLVVT